MVNSIFINFNWKKISEIMAGCGYVSEDEIIVDEEAGLPLNTTPGTANSGNKRKRRRPPLDARKEEDKELLEILKREEKEDDSAGRFGKDVAEFLRTLSKKKELKFKMKIQHLMIEYMEEKEN